MASFKSFEELAIWQIAREINREIYNIIDSTKLKTDFILKDQMSRASSSIMNNIAEGFGRGGTKEFIQFLSISRGSVNELIAQVFQCVDSSYIENEKGEIIQKKLYSLNKHFRIYQLPESIENKRK